MTQKDKELLIKDLSARLPYHVMVCVNGDKNALPLMGITFEKESKIFNCPSRYACEIGGGAFSHTDVRPYLRPMSSMTEEERAGMGEAIEKDCISPYGEIKSSGVDNLLLCTVKGSSNLIDWLNKHHFDYRGLIDKGLALEATKDMY